MEELELDHQHLRKLHGLERLSSLRRASFCNNELARIEGLEQCALLEELSLEDNRLTKLENVSSLLLLTKLDLGKNKIARIEGRRSPSQAGRPRGSCAAAARRPPRPCLLGLARLALGDAPHSGGAAVPLRAGWEAGARALAHGQGRGSPSRPSPHPTGLEPLVQLAQLSLEDNEIASLAGLGKLASLMEVYIGNNRLSSLKEVRPLAHAARL